jgi:hypothetical protein
MFKRGDLVKTKCFVTVSALTGDRRPKRRPNSKVGEVGIIVRRFPRIVKCWEVLIGGRLQVITQDSLDAWQPVRKLENDNA